MRRTILLLFLAACAAPPASSEIPFTAAPAVSIGAALAPNIVEGALGAVLPQRGSFRVFWGPKRQPLDAPIVSVPMPTSVWTPPTVGIPMSIAFTSQALVRGKATPWPGWLLVGTERVTPLDLAPFGGRGYWLLIEPRSVVAFLDGDAGVIDYRNGVMHLRWTPPSPGEWWLQCAFAGPTGVRTSGAVRVRVGTVLAR